MNRNNTDAVAAAAAASADVSTLDPLLGVVGDDGVLPEDERPARPPVPKLDTERLLGENGLPKLRRVSKSLKFKGKGHEAEDLASLMRFYHVWAHRLFPKFAFSHFASRAEDVCRQKRVHIHFEQWIREALGPAPGESDHEDNQRTAQVAQAHTIQEEAAETVTTDPLLPQSDDASPATAVPTSSFGLSSEAMARVEEIRRKARERLAAQEAEAARERETRRASDTAERKRGFFDFSDDEDDNSASQAGPI
ncbi:chromosome segregation in meiosis- protein [Sorochytrium milnesiophthora]